MCLVRRRFDEPVGREGAAAGSGASAPSAVAAAKGIRLLRVGTFDQPTYLAAPPGDRTRRFVAEREGRIVLLRKGRRSNFLDIASRVETGGESGLLSMAFHPRYESNRRYFVYYVANDGALTIFQFRATAGGNATREGSGRLVMRVPHPRFNHKGGQLQFGPDGMLYAGFGDGGGGGDPDRNAQDLGELLGKLVRIDPKPGGGYRIPRGNPFVGRSGARGEIFAYGLRNPYRFSFDRATGDLTIGDVGQDEVEEIDFLPSAGGGRGPRGGANFGWSVFEGNSRYRSGARPATSRRSSSGRTTRAAARSPAATCSATASLRRAARQLRLRRPLRPRPARRAAAAAARRAATARSGRASRSSSRSARTPAAASTPSRSRAASSASLRAASERRRR